MLSALGSGEVFEIQMVLVERDTQGVETLDISWKRGANRGRSVALISQELLGDPWSF